MTVVFRPSVPAGSIAAPPSKSMAHRLLICAGLAAGESRVRGVAPSQDVLATLDCLRALGADCRLDGDCVTLRGADPFSAPSGTELSCRECGSTLRFFVPIALLSGADIRLKGSESLFRRPLGVYAALCGERSLYFEPGHASLALRGPLPAGEYALPGDVSSQFVSGLLFALPLLNGDSTIHLRKRVESRPYIDMTLSALRTFGVTAQWRDEAAIALPGNQRYRPTEVTVEGDWSNAAFFEALGVSVTGLDSASLQGDRVCAEHFARLRRGCAEIDISDCPDLGPVLFAYAAARHGGRFTGTRRLRIKESDRAAAMAEELEKFGAGVELRENSAAVGKGLHPPALPLDGHNDHRIVMALSVLCARTGGVIRGAEAVNKSFPDFFDRLREIHVDVEELS